VEHEEVRKRINRMVSCDSYKTPIRYLIEFMAKKGYNLSVERCLTLGCVDGNLERELSQFNFCLRHDAFDISDKQSKKPY